MDDTTGARLSTHRFGGGADMLFTGATCRFTPEQFRQEMFNRDMHRRGDWRIDPTPMTIEWAMQYAARIEHLQNGKPISWFHVDCGNDPSVTDGRLVVINV
jgi:hypothetical protein